MTAEQNKALIRRLVEEAVSSASAPEIGLLPQPGHVCAGGAEGYGGCEAFDRMAGELKA